MGVKKLNTFFGFLAQTYCRDTGQTMSLLSVPVFVKGIRYGSLVLGWSVE